MLSEDCTGGGRGEGSGAERYRADVESTSIQVGQTPRRKTRRRDGETAIQEIQEIEEIQEIQEIEERTDTDTTRSHGGLFPRSPFPRLYLR